MRQFIHADKEIFAALILVDVALVRAIAETRDRPIQPFHLMFRFRIAPIRVARHISPEILQQHFQACASLRARTYPVQVFIGNEIKEKSEISCQTANEQYDSRKLR
jgi:hypothetical protein